MDELLQFLKDHGDKQLAENLLAIAKANYGKLKKFKFTAKNHKLNFTGDIEDREFAFKQAILKYQDKYPIPLLDHFFNFWSDRTQDGKRMKFEKQDTFEVGKRLATWNHNNQKYGK